MARSKAIAAFMNRMRGAVNRGGGTDPKMNHLLANVFKDYKAASLPLEPWNRSIERLKVSPLI